MSCQVVLLGFPLINKEGLQVLNVQDTPRYMRYMDYLIGQVFLKEAVDKGWTVSDLGKPELFQQLYDKTRTYLAQDYLKRKDDLSPKVRQDLIRIATNWDIFAAYHSKYNAVAQNDEMYNEVVNSEDNRDEEDNKEVKEEFDSTGNDKSTYELASSNLKLLFRILPKLTVKSINGNKIETEEYKDANGLPTSADFSSLWNNVAMKLAGKKSNTDFIGVLTSPEFIKIFPELTIINKLLNLDGEKSKQQVQQLAEFYKIFTRPIIKLYKTTKYTEKNGVVNYRFYPELKGNINKIKNTFISNFITENIPEHLKQYTIRDGAYNELRIKSLPPIGTTSLVNVNYLDINIPVIFKNELELLQLMGITLSGIPLITSYQEKKDFVDLLEQVRTIIYPNVVSRLAKGQLLTNPIVDLSVKFSGDTSNKVIIDKIINLESYYSTLSPTLMSRNSNGEPQSDLSNDNAVSVAIYDLNRAKTLDELYTLPSFLKASYSKLFGVSKAVQFLFDKNGNKIVNRSIDVINYNGAQLKDSKVTRDLTETEKRVIDFNNMLLYGVNDMMRTETSNSFYALRLLDNNKSCPYYSPNSFKDTFSSNDAFKKDMLNYLKAELDRIATYEENPSVYKTSPNYGKFSIFSEILFPELQESIKKDLDGNLDKFYQAIDRYLQPQVEDFVNKIQGGKLKDFISLDLKDTPLRDLTISFLANSFLTNVEMSALVSGESLFYKDMAKRLKGLASTGALASNINDINNFINNNENEKVWKSLYSLSSAMNVEHRDNSNNFKTQVINEAESRDNAYTALPLKEGIQQSIKLRDGKDISIEEVEDMIKDGAVIKVSDGQGHITLDFHRELSFRFGFWTPELEIAYEYEGMYFRKMNPQLKQSFDEKEFERLQKLIYSNTDRYAIPVLKVTYFGNVENEDVKVDAKAYDKFSIAPLVPSFVSGHPELDNLNKRMVKSQIGYAKYESATKLFVRKSVSLSQVGRDADIYTTPLLKEQLKTSIKQKKESAVPTQFAKLLMANLFNQGKAINPKVQKVWDKYVQTLLDIQAEHQIELLDDLGYSYEIKDGKPSILNFNPEKLYKKIQVEVSRQNMSSNVSRALEVNKDAEGKIISFKYSPEATGVYAIINDYISGIVDKSLRRYKVNSADFVLISSANIAKKLKYYEYDENGTHPCEVKITLTSTFVGLLNQIHPTTGERIGTIENLNILLKDTDWVKANEKALTVVFSRPPVGGPGSMGHGIVEEFLPPTMGNVLMLPEEFIAKAGIDFDIDKEKVIIPILTKNGEYVSKENMDKIKDKIVQLEADYPELREYATQYQNNNEDDETNDMLSGNDNNAIDKFISALFQSKESTDPNLAVIDADNEIYRAYKNYFQLKGMVDNSSTNRLLEQYIPALSLAELFADLITPSSTSMVKPLAAQNAKDFGKVDKGLVDEDGTVKLPALGKVYEYNEQLRTMQSFFGAKSLLGGFAVDNTFQQLNTQSGLEINKTYKDMSKAGKLFRSRTINLLLFSPEQREKIQRGDRIIMSSRFNLSDKLIQHYNNEFINSTVDSAKDLYFPELNISWRNMGPFNMLKDMGLDVWTVINFVNNPIILEYLDYRNNNTMMEALSLTLHKMGIGTPIVREEKVLVKQGTPGFSAVGKKPIRNPNDKNDKGIYFENIIKVNVVKPFEEFGALDYLMDEDVKNEGMYISPERLAELKDSSSFSEQTPEERLQRMKDYVAILANFVQFENHSKALAEYRRLYNYDTTKISSSFEVRNKDMAKDRIRQRALIPSEFLSKID